MKPHTFMPGDILATSHGEYDYFAIDRPVVFLVEVTAEQLIAEFLSEHNVYSPVVFYWDTSKTEVGPRDFAPWLIKKRYADYLVLCRWHVGGNPVFDPENVYEWDK